MDITEIDKNFENRYSFEGLKTYDIEQTPFRLFGLCRDRGEQDYKRLPHGLVKELENPGVQSLYTNTSGIRLRFKTDSKQIVLSCELPRITKHLNMAMTGASCFDLYADGHYCNVFRPGVDINGDYAAAPDYSHGYTSGYTFEDRKERDILIHFPLYNDVTKVYLSLEEGASLLPCGDYKIQKPVVYYGSSITQGGCASHPGNCYCAMLSRWLDADYVNLGFSGSCKAEPELAEYIGSLDMHAFVYDYDHNAPTAEFLQKTHEPFFQLFRKYQPKVPVIMVSGADLSHGQAEHQKRKQIIQQTYLNARSAGDDKVYFIDGDDIYRDAGLDYCTVDDTHPNDLGFWYMAKTIGKVLQNL